MEKTVHSCNSRDSKEIVMLVAHVIASVKLLNYINHQISIGYKLITSLVHEEIAP